MKITLVIDQYDDSNNGTTVTARRYAEQLRLRGHKVTILAAGKDGEDKIGAPIHKLPFFQKLVESQGMCFAKPDDEAYYRAFKDADIIHFYLPLRFCRRGEEIARQMKKPVVAAFHMQPENVTSSIGLGKVNIVNEILYRWMYDVFYNRFEHIHCPSKFIANQLKSHGYDAKLHVISNGVDDYFVSPAEFKKIKDGEKIRILMIGRLSKEKRQDLIIKAAAKSKYASRIQIVLAGNGPLKEKYRKMGEELANPIEFGFFTKEELRELIYGCDLYIHASDAEIEGISCMEAFACGLVPVISDSALSATNQFALCDDNLFSAGDADDLAEKIDYWIEHPEEKEHYAKEYAELGDELRVSECVKKAEEMYDEAIKDYRKNGYKKTKQSKIGRFFHPNPDKALRQYCKGRRPGRWLRSIFLNIVSPVLYIFNRIFFGFRVYGRKNLRKIKGGAVTVMNHVHPMDCTMVKLAIFPKSVYFVSLKKNLELPFVGWPVKLCGGVPLPDNVYNAILFQHAVKKRLAQGEYLHFYPEGMLVPYHDGLRFFFDGAFYTSARTGRPVLPMLLTYREPKGLTKLWKKKPCLQVHICEPLYPDASLSNREAAAKLSEQARAAMEEHIKSFPPDVKQNNLDENNNNTNKKS